MSTVRGSISNAMRSSILAALASSRSLTKNYRYIAESSNKPLSYSYGRAQPRSKCRTSFGNSLLVRNAGMRPSWSTLPKWVTFWVKSGNERLYSFQSCLRLTHTHL